MNLHDHTKKNHNHEEKKVTSTLMPFARKMYVKKNLTDFLF